MSEGEVGEDECVWGRPATDVLGLFMGGGDVPGWAGETTLSLERDHRGLEQWRGLENRKDLGWALERAS